MNKRQMLNDPQSCLNKAGDDEIIFVLREKDLTTAGAIRDWVKRRTTGVLPLNKMTDPKILEALSIAGEIEWNHSQGKWGGELQNPNLQSVEDSIKMIRGWISDCFPPNDKGQMTFGAAMVLTHCDTLERFLTVYQGMAALAKLQKSQEEKK